MARRMAEKEKQEGVISAVAKAAETVVRAVAPESKAKKKESPKPKNQAKKTVAELEQRARKTASAEQQKAVWAQAADRLRHGQQPNPIEASVPLEQAHGRIKSALKLDPTLEWLLPKGELPSSPLVAQVVSEIAESPLRDDPNFLLVKGAELKASITDEISMEAGSMLTRIRNRVLEQKGFPTRVDATIPLSNEQRDEFLFVNNTLREIGTTGRGRAGFGGGRRPPDNGGIIGLRNKRADLFEGLPSNLLPIEAQQRLADIQSVINDPNISAYRLQGFFSEIDQIQKDIRRAGGQLNAEQIDLLNVHKERIHQEIGRQQDLAQIPNSIVISDREVAEMETHAIGAMDKWIAEAMIDYIKDPNSQVAQEKLGRIRLKVSYFLSERFDDNRIQVIAQGMSPAQFQKRVGAIRDALKDQRERYLGEFTTRFHLAQFHHVFKNAAEVGDKELMGTINRFSEKDWFSIDGMYGGIVGDVVEIVKKKFEAKLWDNSGRLQGLEPDFWDQARKEAVDEMIQLRNLYEPRFNDYLDGIFLNRDMRRPQRLFHARKGAARVAMSYEVAVRHIVDLASIRTDMWFDHAAIHMRGMSPLLHNEINGGPSSYLQKVPVESIMRLITFQSEVWGNIRGKPGAEKAFLRNVAKYWAKASPDIGKWANDRANEFEQRINAQRGAFGRGIKYDQLDKGSEEKRLVDELRMLFMYNPEFAIQNPPTGDRMIEFIQRFTGANPLARSDGMRQLHEECLITSGLTIAESHWLRPYLSFGSSWRRSIPREVLNEYMGNIEGIDVNHLFLNDKLLKAADEFYKEKFTGDPEHAQEVFVKALYDIAAWRPHDLALAMHERGEKTLVSWFIEQGIVRENIGATLSKVSLRTSVLNRELLKNLKMTINYNEGFEGLSEEQRQIVNKVFIEGFGIDEQGRDAHFAIMKALSTKLRGSGPGLHDAGLITLLRNIKYEPLLTNPRFSDDLPLDLLENPERLKLVDQAGQPAEFSTISERLTMGSWDEQSGEMRRNWRDMSLAEQGKKLIFDSFLPDQENFVKLQQQLWDIITPYQGPYHAAVATMQNIAGWGGAARVYARFGPLLEKMANSSDFKKYGYGSNAPSLSADELREFVEKVEFATVKFTTNADHVEGLFEAMNSYLDITKWRDILTGGGGYHGSMNKFWEKTLGHRYGDFIEWLDDNWPSGVHKLKLLAFPLYFGGLVLVYTVTVAAKEGKEAVSN